jgi:hypothetical protein
LISESSDRSVKPGGEHSDDESPDQHEIEERRHRRRRSEVQRSRRADAAAAPKRYVIAARKSGPFRPEHRADRCFGALSGRRHNDRSRALGRIRARPSVCLRRDVSVRGPKRPNIVHHGRSLAAGGKALEDQNVQSQEPVFCWTRADATESIPAIGFDSKKAMVSDSTFPPQSRHKAALTDACVLSCASWIRD